MPEDPYKHIRENIEEDAEYPKPNDKEAIRRISPHVYEAYFGRRYILPNYRQPYYFRQQFTNFIEWAGVQYYPLGDPDDEIVRAAFACSALALHHRRPQLFLEPELGEPLIRSELPLDRIAEQIKWKWPAFRIHLPKGLITIEREGYEHSLMFLDLAHLIDTAQVPKPFGAEFDRYLDYDVPGVIRNIISLQEFYCGYKEPAIIMSGMIEKGPTSNGLTTYGIVKPFSQYTLEAISNMNAELSSEWPRDSKDEVLMQKMELLGLQTLMFLSAYPLEYPSDEVRVLRKPRMADKNPTPGLYPAKFVGQSQVRPRTGEGHHVAQNMTEHEWHMKHHWRCGHWKQQPFGPGHKDRKWIWINPYQAGQEEKEDQAL